MHLSPQYFITVKIIWVFLSYLFHRNLQKVLFLYKLSLKVANIEILQKPSILKIILSKNLQKGSIWRLNAQKNIQKPLTWRLNAQKTFKNLRPEGSDLRPGLFCLTRQQNTWWDSLHLYCDSLHLTWFAPFILWFTPLDMIRSIYIVIHSINLDKSRLD